MANIQFSSLNFGRVAVGVAAFIVIFKLFFSGSPTGSHHRLASHGSWHGSWRLKLPSWAKPEVKQNSLGFMPLSPEVEDLCAHYRWKPFADRYHRRKIYDMVIVNDELELLALRMAEMEQVDYFIVVESEISFSGNPKPLYVQENYDYFAEFHDKLVVATLNETALDHDKLTREAFFRNAAFDQVMPLLEDEMIPTHGDVLISGNVDEMIRPEVLTALRNCEIPQHVRLWTKFYYYSFQWLNPANHAEWDHPDVTFFNGWKDTLKPSALRDSKEAESHIYSAGWRCTYCFSSIQDIVNQVASSSHSESSTPGAMDPANILKRVRAGIELSNQFELFRIDNNKDVPGYVVRNPERYGFMLDRDPEDGNFVDTWDLIQDEEGGGDS